MSKKEFLKIRIDEELKKELVSRAISDNRSYPDTIRLALHLFVDSPVPSIGQKSLEILVNRMLDKRMKNKEESK
jgi:hypothetical protein